LDEKGNLSEEKNVFISKRNCKLNRISELYTLKQGISKEWVQILSKENVMNSLVDISKDNVICKNQ
jgi:hypothetical protein